MANKPRIHYLSCHEILEFDEVSLFTEMGYEVFSNGAYMDPKGHKTLKRPGIPGGKYFPEYEALARQFPKTNLPLELIDPFDIVMVMHEPEWISENWEKLKHKTTIWRSIGQSHPEVENTIRRMRYEGMKIVRYSPMERNIPGFVGEDAMIRFYKDPSEFAEWNGREKRMINITQTLKGRRDFCHYDQIMQIAEGFPFLVYGSGNDNLGPLNGGEPPYELLKGILRDNRVFLYGGTWPACYTLSFVEALMTGIPVVALGYQLAQDIPSIPQTSRLQYYEVPALITPGQNGFVSDSYDQLRDWIHQLLEKPELAKQIGDAGRAKAIEVFGKKVIQAEWEKFFATL